MSFEITLMRAEDAIAAADDFLEHERGTTLDGDFASQQLAERVLSVEERATTLLHTNPLPNGLFAPLSQANPDCFSEAAFVLPGYIVLIPSTLVDRQASPSLYPAVVSEDGLKTGILRLHVQRWPYRQKMLYGTAIALSGAGQSETAGIGDHGRLENDGVEAEHFATLLAAGTNHSLATAWQQGLHPNHRWRQASNTSVIDQLSRALPETNIDQKTITITKQQIELGQAMIFWHQGLQNQQTGQLETASHDRALLIVQGLGFEALKTSRPDGLTVIKRLLDV